MLAQQIVAEAACEDWRGRRALRPRPARLPLPRPRARGVRRRRADARRRVLDPAGPPGALIHHDAVNGRLRGRRGARLLAITSGGAIPDTADYRVVLEPEDTFIGTVNEDFAIESIAGDIFQLGNLSWRILRVQQGVVRVEDARGQPPGSPSGWARRRRGATSSRRRCRSCGGSWTRGSPIRRRRRGLDRGSPRRIRRHVRRGGAAGRLSRRGAAAPRRAADTGDARRRAVLRRVGRHAARHARAVREPDEPGLGTRAPQALLPPVQLRAAGGGDRGRAAPVARTAALVPARRRVPVPPSRRRSRDILVQALLDAPDVRDPLALERDDRARDPAQPRRPQGAAAAPADAGRRPDGRRVPRRRGLPREHPGRSRDPRSSARPPDDARLPARGDGPRRAHGRVCDGSRAATSAAWRATCPSRRRSRTRS